MAFVTEDEAMELLWRVMNLNDDMWQQETAMLREFVTEEPRTRDAVLDFIEIMIENLSPLEFEQLRPGWHERLTGDE
jgi:hypothetical protein